MPAALLNARSLYQALRLPVKGNEPKAPALTLPDSLSPSTVPVNSRVIGMGEVILADQVSALPSTLPLVQRAASPARPVWVPVSALPSVLRSRLGFLRAHRRIDDDFPFSVDGHVCLLDEFGAASNGRHGRAAQGGVKAARACRARLSSLGPKAAGRGSARPGYSPTKFAWMKRPKPSRPAASSMCGAMTAGHSAPAISIPKA